MCLIAKRIFPKRAKEDIIVYKVLDCISKDKFTTPLQGTKVYLGMTLKAKNSILQTLIQFLIRPKVIMGEGVHAYTRTENAYFWKGRKQAVTVWIIPKGTLYWLGKYNSEIAARKMVFIDVLDPTKPLSVAISAAIQKYYKK